ncbi:hypothetical protein [Aeribacillus pallidus]|jgi:uncharacterized Zn finger protein|nr:hypothetical protein [Bacillus sp. (in: firmicutes)]
MYPLIKCPKCRGEDRLEDTLTAQSNQNVIYRCSRCGFEQRNIVTKKG